MPFSFSALGSVLEALRDAVVFVDGQCRVVLFNPAAQPLLGFPMGSVHGQRLGDVLHVIETASRDPVRELASADPRAIATLAYRDGLLLTTDAREVPIALHGVALETGAAVVIRDLSEQRRAQAELQRALQQAHAEKDWYSLVLRSISEEVYFTDMQGRYRYANRAVLSEFGHDTVEGVPVERILRELEVLRPDGTPRPIEEAPPLRALAGEVVHNEEQIVRNPRSGELRHRQVSSAPVRGRDGTIIGSVSVARDITERKRVEAALREADRRKDIFLATLSHELRNPLAPIRNAANLLETAQLEEAEQRSLAAIIGRQVAHLASLLDDLLDVSRLSRGDFRLQEKDVALDSLIEAALEAAEPAIAKKGHVLRVTPPPPLLVHVDPVRLTQIISNLLSNAARYTDPGGAIALDVELDADALQISVTDTGIGLEPEHEAQVFEMFVQLDRAKQQRDGGLGIGLALVKALVEKHGGTIHARSAGVGCGSTFVVRLPRSCVRSGAPVSPTSSVSQAPSTHGLRILVADDNADGADMLAMLLQRQGHDVVVTYDGPGALDLADRERPEVALLDIGMPGLTGYDVARAIRSKPWGREVLLIAMTGWGRDEDRRAAAEAGFDRHLTKPVDPALLKAALARREP